MLNLAETASTPEGAVFAGVDVADDAAVRQAVDAFAADHEAAGVLWFDRDRSLPDVDLDVWDRVLDINLKGATLAARHCVPWMREHGGAMVHIASIQALRGDAKAQDACGVSKAGLLALSKSLVIHLAADRLRSNAILPGAIHTPMQRRWSDDPSMADAVARAVPLGRLGAADDIADAAMFLLSDAASYISGAGLIVDGGVTALPCARQTI